MIKTLNKKLKVLFAIIFILIIALVGFISHQKSALAQEISITFPTPSCTVGLSCSSSATSVNYGGTVTFTIAVSASGSGCGTTESYNVWEGSFSVKSGSLSTPSDVHYTTSPLTSSFSVGYYSANVSVGAYSGLAGGTISCPGVSVNPPPVPPAPIAMLFSKLQTILQGVPVTLFWNAQNVTDVSIDQGIGSVYSGSQSSQAGTKTVTPSKSTTYTLTAVGLGGSTTTKATISVIPLPSPPPPSPPPSVGPTSTIAKISSASGVLSNPSVPPIFYVGDQYQISVFASAQPTLYIDSIDQNGQLLGKPYSPSLQLLSGGTYALSGAFRPDDVGLYEAWAVLGSLKPVPINFAVVKPTSTQAITTPQGATTTCKIYVGPLDTGKKCSLNLDKTFIAPPASAKLTLSCDWPGSWAEAFKEIYCSATDSLNKPVFEPPSFTALSLSTLPFPFQNVSPTSSTSYSFDCLSGTKSVCGPGSNNTSALNLQVFGGSAGGIREIVP